MVGEKQQCIDRIIAGIKRLEEEVLDVSDKIPAYDQRTYKQAIDALREKLNEKTAKSGPRSRFQFKKRTPAPASQDQPSTQSSFMSGDSTFDPKPITSASAIVDDDGAQVETGDSLGQLPSFARNYNEELARRVLSGEKGVHRPSFSVAKNITIDDHEGIHIMLPSSASRATTSGNITNMRRCIVDMTIPTSSAASGVPFAALALKNINSSLVVAGHVAGAAHLTGLRNCVVVVAARQVRIHECSNVDIYLWCASHPIIEDCTGMRFAPLPANYVRARVNCSLRLSPCKISPHKPRPRC